MDTDDLDDYMRKKFYCGKRKWANFLRGSDYSVEVKATKSTVVGRSTSTPQLLSESQLNYFVGHDIWFHVSMYIAPEDVQKFALICKETAKLVNTRIFWLNMYKRYCLVGNPIFISWNLSLPAHLQFKEIYSYDKCLRSLVIEALFHCYDPLQVRVESGYRLDCLLQRTFISCWQLQTPKRCIVFLKFKDNRSLQRQATHTEVVNDWEDLADSPDQQIEKFVNPHEGVYILMASTKHFVPLPTALNYNLKQSLYKLKAVREKLCTDMSSRSLELDFTEGTSNHVSVILKYDYLETYDVLPWWHPQFKRFLK